MRIAIPLERAEGERRVAMVPEVARRLLVAGHSLAVEAGAGEAAHFADALYLERGVGIAETPEELFAEADLVCTVQPPGPEVARLLPEGVALVSFDQPTTDPAVASALASRRVTAFSLDLLPRISRAQAMDALSSQASVSGYRAALLAAEHLPRFFPMMMTAAGTVPPAKVLVLGAGVAGLGAIATARRLGAVVRGHDVRQAAKEEVESLGATFVELTLDSQEGAGGYARAQSEEFLTRQRELIAAEVARADAVICTAAVPGRRAPLLVSAEMVASMAPGSVIVDIAAETGGNCALSVAGAVTVQGGVTVVGTSNLPSSMATHASYLYARNIAEFVALLVSDGSFAPDYDDEIVSATCVLRDGVAGGAPAAAGVQQ